MIHHCHFLVGLTSHHDGPIHETCGEQLGGQDGLTCPTHGPQRAPAERLAPVAPGSLVLEPTETCSLEGRVPWQPTIDGPGRFKAGEP